MKKSSNKVIFECVRQREGFDIKMENYLNIHNLGRQREGFDKKKMKMHIFTENYLTTKYQ